MKDFHPLQLNILQKLLYSNGLKFSHIKPLNIEGSLFTFHLEQLIHEGFVIKNEGSYSLSDSGKELANRMDLGDKKIENQAKISVILVCKRNHSDNEEFLLYTRLKSPFYSYQGFPTGKVKRGENIETAASRELLEETGLVGTPKLFAIRHYKIKDTSGKLLEDKVFFAYKFINPTGEIIANPEGRYEWVKKNKIWDYLKKPVNEIEEILEALENKSLSFMEKEYSTEGF